MVNAVASNWVFESHDFKKHWLKLFHQHCGETIMKDVSLINMNPITIHNIREDLRKQNPKNEYAIVDGAVIPVQTGNFNVSFRYKNNSMEMNVEALLDSYVVSCHSRECNPCSRYHISCSTVSNEGT